MATHSIAMSTNTNEHEISIFWQNSMCVTYNIQQACARTHVVAECWHKHVFLVDWQSCMAAVLMLNAFNHVSLRAYVRCECERRRASQLNMYECWWNVWCHSKSITWKRERFYHTFHSYRDIKKTKQPQKRRHTNRFRNFIYN